MQFKIGDTKCASRLFTRAAYRASLSQDPMLVHCPSCRTEHTAAQMGQALTCSSCSYAFEATEEVKPRARKSSRPAVRSSYRRTQTQLENTTDVIFGPSPGRGGAARPQPRPTAPARSRGRDTGAAAADSRELDALRADLGRRESELMQARSQIAEIQSSTDDAVKAIGAIAGTMSEVNEYTGAIAASVVQQGAATNEINANVQNAASRTQSVVASIGELDNAVGETTRSAASVLGATREAFESTGRLRTEIQTFLKGVTAA